MLAAMTLEIGDLAVIGGMVGGMMAIPLTLVVFNLKTLTKRVESVEHRIEKVSEKKTDKHEWARETMLTRERLDLISVTIGTIDGKLEAFFGIAASVNRLTEAFEKWRTSSHAE